MRDAFTPRPLRSLRRPGAAAVATAVVVLTLLALPAAAQMVLPGAVLPAPEGAPTTNGVASPASRPPRPKPAVPAVPVAPPVPTPLALNGKTLLLNGGRSQVSFAATDKQISVSRLVLGGTMISNSRADCRVPADATPITLVPLGHPRGVDRLQLGFPACPIVFDVLDGAVLAEPGQPACDFKAADCHVDPTGLWGPAVADFTPARDKEIERARGHADAEVRSNYKALVGATKDRAAIMGFAREQAQFSSSREEICRTYAGEGQHGYCAMKLAEARAADLRAKLFPARIARAARKAKEQARRGAVP